MTYRETITVYKAKQGVIAHPCKSGNCQCQDYKISLVDQVSECHKPWPLCLTCGHGAEKHDPNFVTESVN